MLTVLSPAKTLDYDTPSITSKATQPRFLDQSASLVEDARRLSLDELRSLMGISDAIATLNHDRFLNWQSEFSLDNAKQAVLAFRGDVYTGLDADTLNAKALGFAQQHLRILSGLYGLLRPLDLMQPYRLEMGLKFANRGGKNLYEFWGESITQALNSDLEKSQSAVLVNLASNEYFKAVKPKHLDGQIITPVFKDLKNGRYKMISFYAKKARGLMARYVLDHALNDPEGLKDFDREGYYFCPEQSVGQNWVFLRDAPPSAL